MTSIADDAAMPCVEEFIECVMDGGPRDTSKARVQAFLASRDTPGKRLGEAAMAGYWAFDHPAFDGFRQLLSML